MAVETLDILACINYLRTHESILDKKNIAQTYAALGNNVQSSTYYPKDAAQILLGDDAAAIPQEDGSHLLLAAEGIITQFLENDPWFAGYSAVMVNISDICAMGGLPVAITDTLYAYNANDSEAIWQGMVAASKAYGVPIVGGHTCYHSKHKALSVSILGKATGQLLNSFDAKPGEAILLAMDLNGTYYKNYPFWNASTTTSPDILQKNAKLPYTIANNKWSSVAKDVSMGGIMGTLLMLLNTSKKGADIHLEQLTKPNAVSWEKWLSSFPSYGYVFTCANKHIEDIQSLFIKHNIQCDCIGQIVEKEGLFINYNKQHIKF
jgi:AIR synthase-related protein